MGLGGTIGRWVRAFAPILSASVAGIAEGQPVPPLEVNWSVNGGPVNEELPAGVFNPGNGTYNYSGPVSDPGTGIVLQFNLTGDPDHHVSGNLSLGNTFGSTITVSIEVALPYLPILPDGSLLQGSVAVGLTVDSTAGTLAALPPFLWQGLVDGIAVGPAASVFPFGFQLGCPGFCSVGANANFGSPTPIGGPAVLQGIGYAVNFSLTPGDQISLTAIFVATFSGPQAHHWVTPAGGEFSNPSNWFPDLPGPGYIAVFDLPGSYTVTFRGDTTNYQLVVLDGDVTFDGDKNPTTYTLLKPDGDAFVVGPLAGHSATLTIETTLHIAAPTARIGGAGAGTLELSIGHLDGPIDLLVDGGTLMGAGSINGAVTNRGIVRPAGGGQGIYIWSAYVQEPEGCLDVVLGADDETFLSPFGANVELAGSLNVTLAPGFDPQPNDLFTVITGGMASGVAGQFDLVSLPAFTDDRIMTLTVTPGAGGSAILQVFALGEDDDFGAPNETAAAGAANRVATGDLNGDEFPDVVVVIPGPSPKSPGSIQVFINQGNDPKGTWQGLMAILPPIPVGLDPSAVTVGFLDADPHLDVAVANAGENRVWVFLNDGLGMGTFLSPSFIDVGGAPSALVAADFGEDGLKVEDTDLAVANRDDGTVWVLSNDGQGNFAQSAVIPTGGLNPLAIDPSDLDNDKDADLAGVNQVAAPGQPGSVFVLRNQGAGTFDPAVTIGIGAGPTDLSLGDFDMDSLPDVVAVNGLDATASILVNQGGGVFALAGKLDVGQSPESVVAVDLDADQDADIAVVATDPRLGPVVQVLQNAGVFIGDMVFEGPVSFAIGADATPNFVVADDLNDDFAADLVTVNDDTRTQGSVTVLLNLICPGDADESGVVNIVDFLSLLAAFWGQCPPLPAPCPFDLDGDGAVDIQDFLGLLAQWGPCPNP